MALPSDTSGRRSINISGIISIVIAAMSLVSWTVVIISQVLLNEAPWEWEWNPNNQFNSWLRLFELVWLFLKGRFRGFVGAAISGVLSILALITGCVGLYFQPRRPAVIGCILGAVAAVPGLLLMIVIVLMILDISGKQ